LRGAIELPCRLAKEERPALLQLNISPLNPGIQFNRPKCKRSVAIGYLAQAAEIELIGYRSNQRERFISAMMWQSNQPAAVEGQYKVAPSKAGLGNH